MPGTSRHPFAAQFFAATIVLMGGFPNNLWATSPWQGELSAEMNLGVWGGFAPRTFASDTIDRYGGNWRALQVPLATGQAYEQIPDFFSLILHGWKDSTWEVYSRLPLRRDLEAWHQSPSHHLVPLSPNELDINVPTESWGQWRGTNAFVKVGRFRPDISPSPNAVVLSGAPWLDALWWQFRIGGGRYDFIATSLNPQLHGTPSVAGESPPAGSEAWQQQNLHISNQRRRIYSAPHKNHFLHRLGYHGSWGWLAILEQTLVGGKVPDFRDINPFMVWHNNYGDGYSKASTTLEMGLTPWKRGAFYWQWCIEDLKSPVGETLGENTPTIMALIAGWNQTWTLPRGMLLQTRIDAVYTDSGYNDHTLPLLRSTSRRNYRSNYRKQEEPEFADTYVVDYPLGYHRGADALDLWLQWELRPRSKQWGLLGEAALLRQGSPITEREIRGLMGMELQIHKHIQARWHLGLRRIDTPELPREASQWDGLIRANLSGSISLLRSPTENAPSQ